MEAIKGIPYGMSNFTDVMEQNCYYVDKTMYLPLLEDQAHYLIFTRPRRFGKSLFSGYAPQLLWPFPKDKFEAQSAEQCDAVLRMGAGKDGRGINCPPDKTDAPGLGLPDVKHSGTWYSTYECINLCLRTFRFTRHFRLLSDKPLRFQKKTLSF